jgi:hypothetical protein
MRTLHLVEEAGPDKLLRLVVPVEEAHRRYQILIVVEPEPVTTPPSPTEQGWPADYFERTAGKWQGEFTTQDGNG